MKKFFSLVLALVMTLSLTTVAWGATAFPTTTENKTYYGSVTRDVFVLTEDVTLSVGVTLTNALYLESGNVTISATTPVTIDASYVTDAIHVVGGTLTLGANVTITSDDAILWANGGNIVIDGAKITSSSDCSVALVDNSGTLTINKGSLAATGDGADSVSKALSVKDGKVYVKGGEVSADYSSAIVVKDAAGELHIEGGKVYTNYSNAADTNGYCAAFASAGKIFVTGGEVYTAKGYDENISMALIANGGQVTVSDDAVVESVMAWKETTAKVTITGGTVTDEACAKNGASLTISGDPYVGFVGADAASEDKVEVSGGTFGKAVPAEYVATGMVPVIKDGTFTVGTAPAASGTTGNNSFSSSTTSGVTTSVSAAEKYAIYQATSTAPVTGWTVKSYTTMATKTVTSNGVTTVSYIPAYYTVTDGTDTVKLYEADANSGLLRIFKGDQFVTYVTPLFDALSTGGYVEGDYIADSAAYIAKDKGCGTYGEDVYKINNDKAYAVDPYGRFVAVINGKVAVYDGASVSKPHTFTDEVTYKSTTDLTVVAIECDECEKVFQVVKTTKLPATYKGATVTLNYGGTAYYVLLESAATSGTTGGTVVVPSTGKVESAATFDAGIAMYVGMSVMAAAGSAVVIGKKKD